MTGLSKRRMLELTAATAALVGVGPRVSWAQSRVGGARLMEGPMVGAVTSTSATIWLRTSGPVPVTVEYDVAPDFAHPQRMAPVTPARDDDHTARIVIGNLKAMTPYYYRILVNGRADLNLAPLGLFELRTAPPPRWRGRFSVAIGSCARIQQDFEQPIWRSVAAAQPDVFLWIGDNIYADTLDPNVFAEEYRRQRAVPNMQPVIRSVPQFATWDDHDAGFNDSDGTNPMKAAALTAFKQYWANPSYGLPDTPGVFFNFSYGGIDFFMLDVRYHRSPNDTPATPEKTMLGAGQLAWLKAALKASQAPFKVIASGSGWTIGKGPDGDAWSAFTRERDELFDFIRTNNIGGVVLTSGDTHVAELNCIPWSEKGGYDLYDLTTSPLAQRTETNWPDRRPEIRIRQVFANDSNFGLMTFDTTAEPTLTYNVFDTRGRRAWDPFVVAAADLKNGVTSWRKTIDATSLHNHERWKAGGPYYAQ